MPNCYQEPEAVEAYALLVQYILCALLKRKQQRAASFSSTTYFKPMNFEDMFNTFHNLFQLETNPGIPGAGSHRGV